MRVSNSSFALSLLALGAAACGGGQADSASNGGGGNVGFGGAQDIGQFRDLLDRGEIPGAETLDANGFFNEHYTELPDADCDQPLCLHGMVSVNRSWVDDSYQAVLRVALNTAKDPAEFQPKPLDLILVVDTSGSMFSDDRLTYVKSGMELLIDELGEEDRLGLVTYSSGAYVRAELGEFAGEEMKEIVRVLEPDGGTNIYDGLSLGMQMAAENLSNERQSRVILLSDGNITVGLPDQDVIELSEDYVAEGIGLTTVGVGNDFNVGLMRGLAERGAGNFYYLEDPSAVAEVFSEELNYFVEPIALGLEVTVASDPSHDFGEVLGTRLWDTTESRVGSISIPAVFMASRKDGDPQENGRRGGGSSLFIQMNPNGGEFQTDTMATVVVRYRLPGSDEVIEQTITVDNPFRQEAPEAGYVSHEEMLEGYAMYNVFLGLRRATLEAATNYDCALRTLRDLRSSTSDWNEVAPDEDITADLALIEQFDDNLIAAGASEEGCTTDPDQWRDDGYYYDDHPRACSAGGGSGAPFALVFMALLMIARGGRKERSAR